MSFRVRPWRARMLRSSPSLSTRTVLPSTVTLTPGGMEVWSFPLGPSKRTTAASTATFTPVGIVTGNFPIRDIVYLALELPHRADQLAADLGPLRLSVNENAFGRRQDVDSQSFADGYHLVDPDINPSARTAHPFQPRDDRPILS